MFSLSLFLPLPLTTLDSQSTEVGKKIGRYDIPPQLVFLFNFQQYHEHIRTHTHKILLFSLGCDKQLPLISPTLTPPRSTFPSLSVHRKASTFGAQQNPSFLSFKRKAATRIYYPRPTTPIHLTEGQKHCLSRHYAMSLYIPSHSIHILADNDTKQSCPFLGLTLPSPPLPIPCNLPCESQETKAEKKNHSLTSIGAKALELHACCILHVAYLPFVPN